MHAAREYVIRFRAGPHASAVTVTNVGRKELLEIICALADQ